MTDRRTADRAPDRTDRRGEPLDDHIDPAQLSPLTRSYLKESFRAIASAQKRVAAETQIGLR